MSPLIQTLSLMNILFIPIFRLLKIELFGFDVHMIMTGIISSIIYYVLSTLFTIFVVISQKKKLLPLLPGILLFPLFVFSWAPLHLYCMIKRQDEWEIIKHTKDIKISDIS